LVGRKERNTVQLFHWSCREGVVLFDSERRKAMAGLRSNDNTSAATCDDIAELFQYERRAIQIDFEDPCR
jgi:tellurite resistance protein